MAWNNPKQEKGRYVNPHICDLKRTLWDVILWRLGYYNEKKTRSLPPAEFQYPADCQEFDPARSSALWLGHSTYLIQTNGLTFLTDPVLSEYCSPIPLEALKRQHAPPLELFEFPSLDVVLLSHNHYDHLDAATLYEIRRLYPEVIYVVPHGVKRWFTKRGFEHVYELNWGDSCSLPGGCVITAVPAQHFSGRTLFDKNKTLWCGYVVECGAKTFYFVGDTGYNAVDFKQIGTKWTAIDLSLIPIGTYVPHDFMSPVHIGPQEAVQIHQDVGSRLSLGMHWKTFLLSDEPPNAPPYDLYLSMKEKNLPFHSFLPLQPGEYVNW
jgi:N-acyl-phosphatidylethanolamine-hydrolysing phospholipase D